MWNNASALGRLSKMLFALVVLMLISAGGVWVYRSPYFPIKEVKITGDLQRVSNEQLQAVAQKYIRGNIFRANLNGAQEAFTQLPWIAKAQVSRHLPSSVDIALIEHQPIARWKPTGLVDSEGNLFNAPTDEHFPDFDGQPEAAKAMVEHYTQFSGMLKPLNLKIVELVHTPRSAWSLLLDNGLQIRLGRENEVARLQRFVDVWPSVLKPQQAKLEYVDMRYKDGFAVRYHKNNEASEQTTEAAQAAAAKD